VAIKTNVIVLSLGAILAYEIVLNSQQKPNGPMTTNVCNAKFKCRI
jgi:hypothetical protein